MSYHCKYGTNLFFSIVYITEGLSSFCLISYFNFTIISPADIAELKDVRFLMCSLEIIALCSVSNLFLFAFLTCFQGS